MSRPLYAPRTKQGDIDHLLWGNRRWGKHALRGTQLGTLALVLAIFSCNVFYGNDTRLPLIRDERAVSVARIWNEVLLEGIRNDNARPTVHARNLWHSSAVMYDAWAAYDDTATTWLLGKTQNGHTCNYVPPALPLDRDVARKEAISFAAYRLIRHRFAHSPGRDYIARLTDDTMAALGYDIDDTSTSYDSDSPAALGNYIAECFIAYGLSDGSNESNNYAALQYAVANPPIDVEAPGNPDIVNLDRWQQIRLSLSIDQSGNVVESAPPFVSPEWGGVDPFSLTEADASTCEREGFGRVPRSGTSAAACQCNA